MSKVFSFEKTLVLTSNLAIKLLNLCEVLVPNISLLLGLEPFKKFLVVVVGGWVAHSLNIVFCFGQRLLLKSEV